MPQIDQFESVFKAAAKPVYTYQAVDIQNVSVVTDLVPAEADALADRVKAFLSVLGNEVEWTGVPGDQSQTVEQLLSHAEDERPDLIVTYRNLHSGAWKWPHSLGRHLDVLTQATDCPVLVIPHPRAGADFEQALENPEVVMAMTDHLTGDDRLVNYAVRFTQPNGTLFLTHVEDDATFERYMDIISKIPSIDTNDAREDILNQLLKEPRDYIRSCRQILEQLGLPIATEKVVLTGHHLSEYRRLTQQHQVALLVMNTKDEDQLAMHGLAYPLAVELRETPLLLL